MLQPLQDEHFIRIASRSQVLQQYAAFADSQLGRWQRRGDGSMSPNARLMTMPLLQLFHAEPGGNKWKSAVDASLRQATSVTQVRALACVLSVVFANFVCKNFYVASFTKHRM